MDMKGWLCISKSYSTTQWSTRSGWGTDRHETGLFLLKWFLFTEDNMIYEAVWKTQWMFGLKVLKNFSIWQQKKTKVMESVKILHSMGKAASP